MSTEHEPFGRWHSDDPVALRRSDSITWLEIAGKLASTDSRTQAHFLNLFVQSLDAGPKGRVGAQMQALAIAEDFLVLEERTAEVLEDIVFYFKGRASS